MTRRITSAVISIPAFVVFILVMAGLQIPDWSIVGEVAVAMSEVPLIRALVALGLCAVVLDALAGRRV